MKLNINTKLLFNFKGGHGLNLYSTKFLNNKVWTIRSIKEKNTYTLYVLIHNGEEIVLYNDKPEHYLFPSYEISEEYCKVIRE